MKSTCVRNLFIGDEVDVFNGFSDAINLIKFLPVCKVALKFAFSISIKKNSESILRLCESGRKKTRFFFYMKNIFNESNKQKEKKSTERAREKLKSFKQLFHLISSVFVIFSSSSSYLFVFNFSCERFIIFVHHFISLSANAGMKEEKIKQNTQHQRLGTNITIITKRKNRKMMLLISLLYVNGSLLNECTCIN